MQIQANQLSFESSNDIDDGSIGNKLSWSQFQALGDLGSCFANVYPLNALLVVVTFLWLPFFTQAYIYK